MSNHYPEEPHPEGTTFMYEIHCNENKRRQFTTDWSVAMQVMKGIHEKSMKCRIYRAPLIASPNPARMAKMMNLAMRAELAQQEPPLFKNSVIMYSDFDDEEGSYATVNPFKEVDDQIEYDQ